MTAVTDLIANIRQYRASADSAPVICDADLLIAALQELALGGGGGLVEIDVTTGAAPLIIDPSTADVFAITTGGTGAQEFIQLSNLPVDANGANPQDFGSRRTFYIKALTNPADTVCLQIDSGNAVLIVDKAARTIAQPPAVTFIEMNYETASANLIWNTYNWTWDCTDDNVDTHPAIISEYIPPGVSPGLHLIGGLLSTATWGTSGTAAAVAGAITMDQIAGRITSEPLVAAVSYVLTLTNAFVLLNSNVLVIATNSDNLPVQINSIVPAVGSVVITVSMAALTGTVLIQFLLIN